MRGHPSQAAANSLHSRPTHEKTTARQRSNNPAYERVGYRRATEGASYDDDDDDMGASGTLQIWPKISSQEYQQLIDSDPRPPYLRSVSDTGASQRSVDDVSTMHSYRNATKTPSQKTSMSSIREAAASRIPNHTLHPAASHPNFHFAKPDSKRRDNVTTPPKSPRSTRSQRLGLSKLFHSKDKDAKQTEKKRYEIQPRISESEEKDTELYHVRGIVKPAEPPQPAIIQRSHQTAFDRNATENAKVNVRRPPKGIKHWFEGLDESDDDFPEVVASEAVTPATFRPSLGPGRFRVAPTSRVSPAADPAQDYFMFQVAGNSSVESHSNSSTRPGISLQEHSMLNLSSSDEDEISEPPSPDRWPEQRPNNVEQPVRPSANFQRNKSNDAGDSVFSMQTTMTSGSIPIINADSFYRTPLPPLPSSRRPSTQESSAMPAPLRTRSSEMTATRSRAATGQSLPDSVASDNSNATASTTHVMTVTQEEMVLLEMMRRKRAEMHNGDDSPRSASRQELHPAFARPRGFERQNSTSRSIASSTISRDSDRSILGTGFPAPPSASNSIRVPSTDGTRNFSNLSADEKMLAYVQEEDDYPNEKSELEPPVFYELEAPLETLSPVAYSLPKASPQEEQQPTPRQQEHQRPRVDKKTGLPPPPYNSADPYSLAPELGFSSMDLLPLPARTYSPSLSTSRSSGVGSQSSALTPIDGNCNGGSNNYSAGRVHGLGVSGVNIVGNDSLLGATSTEICELDVKRNSHMPPAQGAGSDVLAAWNALGGL